MERVIRRIAILTISLVALQAGAEGENTYDQRMLDVLLEQGAITQSQHEELSKEATGQAASDEKADSEAWKVYWKNGFRFERNDGLFKLKFGGRAYIDGAVISSSDELDAFFADPDFRGSGTGVDFRTARIFFSGSFYEHGIFKFQYDFSGQDADFKDVWVGLQKLPGVGQVRVGHFKEAFSLEELTSSKYMTFMERALPVLAFTPRRNTGIALANTAFDKRMTWAAGGFKVVGDSGEAFAHTSGYNVTGRVTGLPLYHKDGRRLIHLGLGYSHGFNSDVVDFGAKPESNSADPLVFTPDIVTNGTDKLGLEFASVLGPLSLQAEFIPTWVDQEGGPNLTFWGTYGTISWFVTGENRPYDTRYGTFGRVKPRSRFSLKEGTWGAFELAARYSYLDLDDENVRGGIESNTTLGANWYLYSNLRLMLNWIHAHRNGAGSEDIVQARVSMDF